MLYWQSQDAKARFSELMRLVKEAPQVITVRGKEEAVLLSKKHYDTLTHAKPTFVKLMQKSPMRGIKVNVKRDTSLPRDVTL